VHEEQSTEKRQRRREQQLQVVQLHTDPRPESRNTAGDARQRQRIGGLDSIDDVGGVGRARFHGALVETELHLHTTSFFGWTRDKKHSVQRSGQTKGTTSELRSTRTIIDHELLQHHSVAASDGQRQNGSGARTGEYRVGEVWLPDRSDRLVFPSGPNG
jgi:hypothetical protein